MVTLESKVIKLPVGDYLLSLNNYMKSINDKGFNDYKIYDYRIRSTNFELIIMSDEIPKLFVEINDSKIIFVAGNYDENLNFSIIEKNVSSSKEFFNDELIDLNRSVEIIKQNIEIIETKINYVFQRSYNYTR